VDLASVGIRIDFDVDGFVGSLPAALEEWRLQAFAVAEVTADKVVDTAKELVAKRTTHLEATIHRDALVRTGPDRAEIVISAGDGTRYALFQEFGTSVMPAHPFMRPALALAAGSARAGGAAAKMITTSKTRAAVKRAAHRSKLRQAVKAGRLTPAEARRESKRISKIRGFGSKRARG
jgi:HK97 gp10 family phage protein